MNNSTIIVSSPTLGVFAQARARQIVFIIIITSCFARAAEPWTLPRAIDFAVTNSPDARMSEQRIRAAQAALRQANAAFSPQLQIQSSYTRTDNPMMVFGSVLSQHAYNPVAGKHNS